MIPDHWFLGFLAGATIVLGLPIARVRVLSTATKALLNAISTGILMFLLVEIAGHLLEEIEELVERAAAGQPGLQDAFYQGGLFVLGFSIGLLGLVYFERRYLSSAKETPAPRRSKQVAMMIALGLGLHNFSEGLAIGQGYASGAFQLAWLLAIGFALHNATEGFGIAAPLAGHRVSWGFLAKAALVAGGPTFVGAIIGGWWVNRSMEVFCLALAAGTILYVIGELLHLGRQLKEESVVAVGLLAGFFIAVLTDFVLIAGMHQPPTVAQASSQLQITGVEAIRAEHEHVPRHGGIFGDADDLYHYEVLMAEKRQLRLYVNDELNRPLRVEGLKARWTVDPDGLSPTSGSFTPSEDGAYLVAQLPLVAADLIHIKVEVRKGSLWAPLEFFVPQP